MMRTTIAVVVACTLTSAVSAPLTFAGDSPKVKNVHKDAEGNPLPDGAIARFGSLRVWAGEVGAVAFSPDGKSLAAGIGTSIRFWDLATGKALPRLDTGIKLLEGRNSLQSLAFSPGGKLLVSWGDGEWKTIPGPIFNEKGMLIGRDRAVQTGTVIWDANTRKKVKELETGGWSLAFFPDSKRLLFAADLGQTLDTSTWLGTPFPVGKALAHNSAGPIRSLAISPDGQLLAVGTKQIHVVNLKTEKSWQVPTEARYGALVAFSADSKQLVAGGTDVFHIWDLATGKSSVPFADARVGRIVVAGNGTLAAWLDSFESREVYLGDLRTATMAKPLRGHQLAATCLAFSTDGKVLATGSRDGTVLLWKVAAQPLFPSQEVLAEQRAAGEQRLPVPADAKVYLELDKQEYFLGENILLHFVVENAGQGLFSIDLGGDYRGATRALRYKVTATDQNGKLAADPNPSGYCLGGIGTRPELRPGEQHYTSLQLLRYCRLEQPGVYKIRASHDLGWKDSDERKTPVAEITIKVAMPDAKQARRIVEDMLAMPKPGSGVSGQKSEPFPDFTCLSYPVYLPFLKPRALVANADALTAIGNMPSPDATGVLIELAEHKDATFARTALKTLNLRLPDPLLEGKLPTRNVLENTWDDQRRWLVGEAWKPEFAPAVRKLAGTLLRGQDDVEGLQCGGFILQCLGEKADLPLLVRALDAAVAQAQVRPLEQHTYPRPRGACMELSRAAAAMMQREIDPPLAPRSPGERIVFAQAIKERKEFLPKGWAATYAAIMKDDSPYVRQVALDCLPDSPDKELIQLVPRLLLDADVDVQIAACHVAGKVKAPELHEPLLKVLGAAKEFWLMNAASNAAYLAVPRVDYIQAFVGRLDEIDMAQTCLRQLAFLVKDASIQVAPGKLTAEEAKACKRAWEQFLRTHTMELSQGRTYALDDQNVPIRELFPKTEFCPTVRK